MFKHLTYQHPTKNVLAVVGVNYLTPSALRKWSREGKLLPNKGNPVFTEPDGTKHRFDDGGLVCPEEDLLFADTGEPVSLESSATLLQRVIDRVIPDGVAYEIIDSRDTTALPPDRIFRNAWEQKPGQPNKVDVNMPKARDLHMDKIRRVRNDELEKLDISFMRAIEAGDAAEQTSITNQKQALRDIPQELDLEVFATPEDLHASWADNLVRPEGEVTES